MGKGNEALANPYAVDAQGLSTPGESTIEDLEAAGHLHRTSRFDGTTRLDDATFNNAWSGSTSTKDTRLDYIFHTGGAITSTSPTVDRTTTNGDSPSDHYPVLATLRLGTGTDFASSPIMDNTGFSGSENTVFFFASIDGQNGADKVYWNPSAYNGDSKVFRALAP